MRGILVFWLQQWMQSLDCTQRPGNFSAARRVPVKEKTISKDMKDLEKSLDLRGSVLPADVKEVRAISCH